MSEFNIIKNEKLRQLVELSESIRDLSEKDRKKMLVSITKLSEEGQKAMIEALTEEQQAIMQAKAKRDITPEKEIEEIKAKTEEIKNIKHTLETNVRKISEKKEKNKSDQVAEEALKEL